MKPNPSLDELLGSFMDGELSPRQRMEVQRMVTHDTQVAQRLRQLQNCRTLFSALPLAEAPGDMLEQIRQSLERQTLLQSEPVLARRSTGRWHLVFRQFVAAAAMIALLAVLGAVVYQILAPVPVAPTVAVDTPGPAGIEPEPLVAPPVVVADAGFSGRLELRTEAPVQVDADVKRAIEDSGLSDFASFEMVGQTRIYRLVSTREGVNRVVTALGRVWPNLDAATLHVDRPGDAATPVVVKAVTPEQATSIVTRSSTEASVNAAEYYAATNFIRQTAPGSEILARISEDTDGMLAALMIPQPKEASNDSASRVVLAPPQGQANSSLTIVLLDAE